MSMNLSRSGIEEILRQDPEIVAVHWPKDWEFGVVDRSLWLYDSEERERHIHLVEDYLRRPCIEDTFESNYLARKKWKGRYRDDDQSWIYYKDQDALRWGTMRTIPRFCEWPLERGYQGQDTQKMAELTHSIRKIVPPTFQEYDKLSTKEKISLVNDLKEQVYTLLACFYVKSPAASQN